MQRRRSSVDINSSLNPLNSVPPPIAISSSSESSHSFTPNKFLSTVPPTPDTPLPTTPSKFHTPNHVSTFSQMMSSSDPRRPGIFPPSKKSPTFAALFNSRRRIFVILTPIVLVYLLIHSLSASSSGSSLRTDAHLRSSRRQRSAASSPQGGGGYAPMNLSDPNILSSAPPFTFCPSYGSTDELGQIYGPESIYRTRSHVGNTERIRKMIKRGMSGLPITIGVLGGSVSSCHGLDATSAHPLGNPIGVNCYPHRIFSWLNDVFPHPANELTNGALRRTGTSYFGFCSEMHLPDRVDLVIVEFDAEDPHDPTTLATTDLLIRSLLLRPDAPAVIMLGHFSPQIQGEYGYAGPETWHTAVAQFYDIPHLTSKGFLYEDYLVSPQKVRQTYYLDPILANKKGHEVLADVIIVFLEQEICQVWEQAALEAEYSLMGGGLLLGTQHDLLDSSPSLLGGKGLRQGGDAGLDAEDFDTTQVGGRGSSGGKYKTGVPPFRITDKPHTIANFREVKPNCASANDLINPLPQSVFSGSGWSPVVPKPDDEDERHYWFTEEPGSLLKVPLKVGAGDIAVYYLRGPASEGWGTVLCWVDDNVAGGVELRGSWERDYGQPTVTQIDRGVSKGAHYVVCELQGQPGVDKGKFKIYGVFST